MNLNDYKQEYQWYSGKASDVVRQLSFAGIAVVWLFKVQSKTEIKVPEAFLVPLGLFCVSLAFDLLQYLIGYITWFFFFRAQEKKGVAKDTALTHSVLLPVPLHFCMVSKVLSTTFAYFFIIATIFDLWVKP